MTLEPQTTFTCWWPLWLNTMNYDKILEVHSWLWEHIFVIIHSELKVHSLIFEGAKWHILADFSWWMLIDRWTLVRRGLWQGLAVASWCSGVQTQSPGASSPCNPSLMTRSWQTYLYKPQLQFEPHRALPSLIMKRYINWRTPITFIKSKVNH